MSMITNKAGQDVLHIPMWDATELVRRNRPSQAQAERVDAYVSPDMVSVKTRAWYAWEHKSTGEVWNRSFTAEQFVFSFRNNEFNIYRMYRVKGSGRWHIYNITLRYNPDLSFFNVSVDPEMWDAVYRQVIRLAREHGYQYVDNLTMSQNFKVWAAPVMAMFYPEMPDINRGANIWRKAKTPQDLIRSLYGVYTKAHMRAFSRYITPSTDGWPDPIPTFDGLDLLRGLVPEEWLTQVPFDIEINPEAHGHFIDPADRPTLAQIRRFLKHFTTKKRLDFVLGLRKGRDARQLLDIVMMWKKLTKEGIVVDLPHRQFDWDRIHTILAIEFIKMEGEDEPIEQVDMARQIDGAMIGGLQIKTPKDTATIHTWGKVMVHCIGMYASSAVNGHVVLFGLYDGERLIANGHLEYRYIRDYDEEDGQYKQSWELIQLRGKYNANLDTDTYQRVVELLKDKGVNIPTRMRPGWEEEDLPENLPYHVQVGIEEDRF